MLSWSVTADVVADGLALLVGLGGRLGVLCSGAVIDVGLRGAAVAHAADAISRIRTRLPRVVIIPTGLAREERQAIKDACGETMAELIELPAIIEPRDVVHAIAKALAISETRRHRQSSVEITVR